MGGYGDNWNPALHSALRDNVSGPADGAVHRYYRTQAEDKYRNKLFTCNCQNAVTGEERDIRQHCLEQALDAQFGGTIRMTPTGFEVVEDEKKPAETEAEQLLALFQKLSNRGKELT